MRLYLEMWEKYQAWNAAPGSTTRKDAYELTKMSWVEAKKETAKTREALKG